jgi:inosine/xanthosine triphosphate pyrophosphatase family protein
MRELLYVTGNAVKFLQAQTVCEPLGITLRQTGLKIHEIQAENGEPVACDKASKAFADLQKPLVISDDSWNIPGLKGFPGPYMSSINKWFTPRDWLRLTNDLADRTIILHQIVVYQDDKVQKVFAVDMPGILLHEARGKSPYAHSTITSLDGGKHSDAEYHERNESATPTHRTAWHEFADWYQEKR